MALGEPFVERIGEQEAQYLYRKLTVYDRAEVIRRDRLRQRAALLQDLKDAGADKREMIETLRDFDREKSVSGDFLTLFDSLEGKADIFDLSVCDIAYTSGAATWARKANADDLMAFLTAMPLGEQTELAAELCGVTLGGAEPEPADEAYGDEPPNPPKGPMGILVLPSTPQTPATPILNVVLSSEPSPK